MYYFLPLIFLPACQYCKRNQAASAEASRRTRAASTTEFGQTLRGIILTKSQSVHRCADFDLLRLLLDGLGNDNLKHPVLVAGVNLLNVRFSWQRNDASEVA